MTVATLPPVCEEKSAVLKGYNAVILRRNEIILEIAGQEAVPVIDLHMPFTERVVVYKEDGILLTDEGAIMLAEECGVFFEKL